MTGPPDDEGPLHGTQQAYTTNNLDPTTGSDMEPSGCRRRKWDTAPTLGAIRRRHGHGDEMIVEASTAFVIEVLRECQRRVMIDRLDSVMQFLAAGAFADQAMLRVRKLVADYDDRPTQGKAA